MLAPLPSWLAYPNVGLCIAYVHHYVSLAHTRTTCVWSDTHQQPPRGMFGRVELCSSPHHASIMSRSRYVFRVTAVFMYFSCNPLQQGAKFLHDLHRFTISQYDLHRRHVMMHIEEFTFEGLHVPSSVFSVCNHIRPPWLCGAVKNVLSGWSVRHHSKYLQGDVV